MIYCPGCGTANRDGSRFCNECGTKMPTLTSALCPTCGRPNPPHSLFCENCSTRLVASLTDEPEEDDAPIPAVIKPKGLSLPTKPASTPEPAALPASPAPEEEEVPDWLQQVVQSTGVTSELGSAEATEPPPAWLSELTPEDASPAEEKKPNTDELLPEWAQRLRTLPEAAQPTPEDEVPDWLKALGNTGRLPSGDLSGTPSAQAAAEGESIQLPAASAALAEPAAEAEELPEWLKESPYLETPATLEESPVQLPVASASTEVPVAEAEEMPEWLKESPSYSEEVEEVRPPSLPVAETPSAGDGMPDWLRDLRPSASTDDALPDWFDELGAEEEPAPETRALSTGDSALDWLSQLGATTPESPSDQATEPVAEPPAWWTDASPTESISPDWNRSLQAAPPEVDSQPVEEVPDWLSQASAAETPAAGETPDWMSSFRSAESTPEPQPEEEGTPAWLQGLGLAAVIADQSEPEAAPATEAEPADWMASLRQATPAIEEERAEDPELPEWLSSSEVSPAAIGEPPASEQEVPDWLRESGVVAGPSEPAASAPAEEEGLPDWLKGLGMAAVGAAAIGAAQSEPEAEPVAEAEPADWMASLRQAAPEVDSQPVEEVPDWLSQASIAETPAAGETPDWMSSFRAVESTPEPQPEEEGTPAWLQGLGLAAVIADQSEPEAEPAAEAEPADWMASLRQATPVMEEERAEEPELPEWLSGSRVSPAAIGESPADEQEVPDWLRESGVVASTSEPAASAPTEEEGLPDWLKGLGMAAAGAAAIGAAPSEPEAEPVAEAEPADWMASLRQAAPAMEEERAEEQELPAWLSESGASPAAIGGQQAYDQEVPDWLRESGVVASTSEPAASAPPEEEGTPDWLKGLGMAAVGATVLGAAQSESAAEPAPEAEPADWMASLRQAAPAMEEEHGEEQELPEWLSESGASPTAIGGPQAYDQEVPDWLRESGSTAETYPPSSTQPEEEGLPDWLKGLGAATVGAAVVAGARQTGSPTEMEVPAWMQEETPGTPLVVEPESALVFETPAEPAEEGSIPDWLRGLTPAAVGLAAVSQADSEEAAEEPEESEPEADRELAGVAGAVATAAAIGAAKGTKADAAPPEMPDWLKELRREQEAIQNTAPAKPAADTGLTQAEIPAWLEALRLQGQPPTPSAAETPSEAEGPLAGIVNALPPAPLMGQVQGAPMKLQYETSADDLARAGVLKELLGQPTVAPASIEQFVIKESKIRRRALRWVMAALIIFALIIPGALDLNQVAGLSLLPNVQTMVVPPAVTSAATQIKLLPLNAKVLVIFDYDASQSGEMNHIAQVLLQGLAARNAQIEIASLNPQGISLAWQVMQGVSLAQPVATLGYAPGQSNGVQDILARMGDVKLVVDLAASADTVRWWAEQLKTSHLTIPFIAGVSAGAETLTMPYLQSSQVAGVVSGLPGALAFLKATSLIGTYPPNIQRDYQVALEGVSLANYTLAVLIIIGLIVALFGGKRKGARS